MRWRDLLFAHWIADAAALRELIPRGLDLDLFEGRAYVGAVPFRMEEVTARRAPSFGAWSAFPELNLRTYVSSGGKPGVWFFSLDAAQKLAVRGARHFFHLPYFDAQFEIQALDGGVDYSARRTHRNAPKAAFAARYAPEGPPCPSQRGTLDAWLTDRYCFYARDAADNLFRCEIDHPKWPLQRATAEIRVNTLGDWLGIHLAGKPQALHFSRSLEVRAWWLERV